MARRPNPFVDSAITPASNWRVLHVEDTLTVRETVRVFLQPMGFLIDDAENASAAISRVQRQRYDLIICDYLLGSGPDGQSLLDKLRRERLIPRSTAFFMLTTERNYSRVAQVVELAPDAYLLKPFTLQELDKRLRSQLDRFKALRPILDPMDSGEWEVALEVAHTISLGSSSLQREARRLAIECMIHLGRGTTAKALLDRICSGPNTPPRWALWERARLARATEPRDHARGWMEQVREAFPHFVPAIDALCEMALEDENLVAAHLWATRAVGVSPTAERLRRLGHVERELGNLPGAEEAFARAAERGRTSFFGDAVDYALAADAALAGNDRKSRERAVRLCAEGKGLASQSPMAKVLLPLVTANAHDNAPRTAIERAVAAGEMEQLVRTSGLDPRVALLCANQLISHGMHDSAVKLLDHLQQSCRLDRGLEIRISAMLEQADPSRRRPVDGSESDRSDECATAGEAGPTSLPGTPSPGEPRPLSVEAATARAIEKNNTAVQLLREGSLDAALELLTHALDEMPDHETLRTNLVKALIRRFDRDGDTAALDDASELIAEGRNRGLSADAVASLTRSIVTRRPVSEATGRLPRARIAGHALSRIFGRQ